MPGIGVSGWRTVAGLFAFARLFTALSVQGADSNSAAPAQNLCVNGSFELLLDAAASPLPQSWLPLCPATSRQIEIVNDAVDGKRSLRLAATNSDSQKPFQPRDLRFVPVVLVRALRECLV